MKTWRALLIAAVIVCTYAWTNWSEARPHLNKSVTTNFTTGRNWFLGIGISDYDSNAVWKDLRNAKGDMVAIAQALQGGYQFNSKSIIALTDSQATKKNILDTLRFLAKIMRENDNLIIYYAGHGYYSERTNMGFWIPSEAGAKTSSFISSEQLKQNGLATNSALHVVLFIDACYSSSIFDDRRARVMIDSARDAASMIQEDHDSSSFHTRGFEPDEQAAYLDMLYQTPSREAFVSGRLTPVTDGGGNHSPFAAHIEKFLNESKTDFTVDVMAAHVMPLVYEICGQVPRYGHLQLLGDEGGNFVFRKSR